jgi:hypothetical protein
MNTLHLTRSMSLCSTLFLGSVAHAQTKVVYHLNEGIALEASVVPSGVAEVATLQAKSGFVNLRP